MCLFLLIFEDWFRQNIVYVPHGGRGLYHPWRKRCFIKPQPGTDMSYTVQYPDVFGVRRCKESVKPDFPLPGWEATVGKAGTVWERRWPRSGRSPLRDGIPNCAQPSGPKQHICLAPAKLRTAKKTPETDKWEKTGKKSNIMVAASKTGREHPMVLPLFAFASYLR